jgi:hypothetical protein
LQSRAVSRVRPALHACRLGGLETAEDWQARYSSTALTIRVMNPPPSTEPIATAGKAASVPMTMFEMFGMTPEDIETLRDRVQAMVLALGKVGN